MDKEDVVHVYNGLLLSHKKEQNRVNGKEIQNRGDMCVYIYMILFDVQQKLTWHCKATIFH